MGWLNVVASYHAFPSKHTQAPRDPNLLARSVVEDLIGEKMDGSPLCEKPKDTRNPAAVALSKLGASKGAKHARQASAKAFWTFGIDLGLTQPESAL